MTSSALKGISRSSATLGWSGFPGSGLGTATWSRPAASRDVVQARAVVGVTSWRQTTSAGVVFTSTDRDGMLDGPDLDGLDRCRALYAGDVYLSGGIATADDVIASAAHGAAGVVIGRALYEGRLALGELLQRFPVAVP